MAEVVPEGGSHLGPGRQTVPLRPCGLPERRGVRRQQPADPALSRPVDPLKYFRDGQDLFRDLVLKREGHVPLEPHLGQHRLHGQEHGFAALDERRRHLEPAGRLLGLGPHLLDFPQTLPISHDVLGLDDQPALPIGELQLEGEPLLAHVLERATREILDVQALEVRAPPPQPEEKVLDLPGPGCEILLRLETAPHVSELGHRLLGLAGYVRGRDGKAEGGRRYRVGRCYRRRILDRGRVLRGRRILRRCRLLGGRAGRSLCVR